MAVGDPSVWRVSRWAFDGGDNLYWHRMAANRGIVFQEESIYGATATTGSGVAIEMARTHLIQWENNAGNVANIGASGDTTDIDIVFTPAGSGRMRFGSHSALAAETVTGYISDQGYRRKCP